MTAATLVATGASRAEIQIDSNTFGGLRARSIGPAVMSGRIAGLDVVVGEPLIIYVASAGGGVWKSDDGGVTFTPIFDDHPQALGAIRVDPSNPDVVWVATGESRGRRGVQDGDGIYRSTDAGESWEHRGLPASERIAAIEVDPTDGDTVWACVTGPLWWPSEERGLYRTGDGGESWELVLHVGPEVGCADLSMDPQDPDTLYAALWEYRRDQSTFTSGGPGSGLYRTRDGGETWTELTEGLPEEPLGRLAVAVAPSRPSRVYSLVETQDSTALYRSSDLGTSWERLGESFNLGYLPFYLSRLVVDPEDYNRVYKPGLTLTVSEDGGESFTSFFTGGFGGGVHPDHHALWIDPRNPRHALLGTDGGLYESHDRAGTWRHVATLPISQFYRVATDLDEPYNVYGGLQDNGSWTGPSRGVGGVRDKAWTNIGQGDGFWVVPDPSDPGFAWLDWQNGNILRVNLETLEQRDIKPFAGPDEDDYRWHWNTPIHASPSEPGTFYVGSQYLLRSSDGGESWQRLSPDLSKGEPEPPPETGGVRYEISNAAIYFIDESPRDAATIWVGTDDGNLQVTRDGGETWAEVSARFPDAPESRWISSVTASPHHADHAFATVLGHGSGDDRALLYATRDAGATWRELANGEGSPVEGYAYIVRQDTENPNLLYLGTELGLWISLDGGESWARFAGDLPRVAVRDLAIHPREGDLVIATHGRGIWILDDLTPLRNLTPEVLESSVALLGSRPGAQVIPAALQDFGGDHQFIGANPPEAAWITYYQKKRHLFGDLKIEIHDEDGELVTVLPAGKRRGINRVAWPMRLPPPDVPPADTLAAAFVGPRAPEGTYKVTLVKGKERLEGEVRLVPDPRSPHSPEDRAAQQATSMRLYEMLSDLTYLVETAVETREALETRVTDLGENSRLGREANALAERFGTFRDGLVAEAALGPTQGEDRLREELAANLRRGDGLRGAPHPDAARS